MLVERITSRQNPLIKRFRRVRLGAERHLIFLEGVRLIEEALAAEARFESIAFSAELESSARGLSLLGSLQRVPCRGANVTKQIMAAIADTETPQGVAALVSRPSFDLADVFQKSPQFVVVADRLQDPGNLGAMVRTAEAAGATGLVSTRGTVDAFNTKALRASMGSALRLPIATDVRWADLLSICSERGVRVFAAQPRKPGPSPATGSSKAYDRADFKAPFALVFGQEGGGISDHAEGVSDFLVYIPMAKGVESLNVAAAAAILMYEAARQRGFQFTEYGSSRTRPHNAS